MLLVLGACSKGPRLEGFILGIEQQDGRPSAFTIDTKNGPERILIDPDRDYGFDPEHLEEHRTDALPVSVAFEERDGEKFALHIEDA